MLDFRKARKYINYLVMAAVLLPLIFIAEVAYVEHQHTIGIRQGQTQEIIRLRTEAATGWIDSQAAYIRAIARLHGTQSGKQEAITAEFHSFLDAGTGLASLAYAGMDGKIQVDTAEPPGRYIGDYKYFTAAASGQEYTGEITGTDWWQGEDVTVVAVPVTVNGEITGIVYGVIRKESIESITAKLVPGVGGGELALSRWLTWLGLVYLLGVIPLLLIVLSRRYQEAIHTNPVADNPQLPGKLGDKIPSAVIDNALAAAVKAMTMAADKMPAAITNETPVIRTDGVFPEPVRLPGKEPAEELSVRDAMTGLYTQAGFEQVLAVEDGKPGKGIIVCSIDGMKVINDFLGYKTGDAIIKAAANALLSAVGSQQITARLDGDKFAVLIADARATVVEDCKKDIKYYVDLHNLLHPELPLSITVGCAVAGERDNLQAVWNKAGNDMESYKAVNRVEARKFIMWSIKRNRRRT
ncbi:diguanylate cyclase domain-containing protein [Sporomusa sp.]|uniref:diguanylate cyclase domain-containing protein n=1 Tax=Sporomusa sp. TaxID=2078658 RepID=UPI002BC402B5|nr:diguanylate cyclase [Sporomusa sp.]HWR45030.1 diguanylate cyclase [Sporomusa sp.]